ncbi:hypothetical protein ACEXQB_013285 [Herbiconiux sp. P18]|uniref:hypothetical protein n=1 Tax=Herbiconiux liangxiaofengii TaxID=3342795 RepID=UPI0035BB1B51
MKNSTRRNLSVRIGVVLAAASVFTLSACASAGSEAASGSAPATAAPDAGGQQGSQGGGGVSGEIAAISGSTLQVQDDSSQTAVTYGDSTTITRTVTATTADITVGSCVTAVIGSPGDTSTTDAATAAAGTVTVTAAVDGACDAGFGFGGGGGAGGSLPEGMTPPTGMPDDASGSLPDGVAPTGAPEGGMGSFGGFTSGLVTAVSGDTITVDATSADGSTESSEITLDGSTVVTKTETADASALTVGACVTAMGDSDDSGTMAATALAVSTAGDDGCSTRSGFGGMGGPGAGGGAGGSNSGSAGTSGSSGSGTATTGGTTSSAATTSAS